ncbi:Mitochondrial inner membrane protein Mitofilin [Arabidopsis thaliana x Arabidopsis arenosa]|uniref:Mitochondrial inner membrane protein Mitofilin n=1 Tax=Arabidopsis thaliana x Arabidopsis arenosa TaxID=1240361 RepID=A0A8T1XYI2_9BRAS|nr:Mitochondrial inner membrane protein Mitofilin [Arabidopsis thaliana x Arabidopsis arenosa]
MLRKSVLELSSRLSIKRFPKNLGAQRFHLSSSRNASTTGKNGVPGAKPVGKPDASKVDPPKVTPPPPVGKPSESKGSSSKVVIGGVAIAGAFLVAYQTGYLDQYLGKEQQKLSERIHSDAVTDKVEEAHHLNVPSGVEDSTEKDDQVETQPEATHSEVSEGMQSDIEVQPESDLSSERFTYISSNQEETTPQESVIDRAERNLPISESEDSGVKSDMPSEIISEAESVKLEAVPKPGDSPIVSAQSSSVHRESETESAPPKDPSAEKAPEDGIEREVQIPGSLLKEYNLEGSDTESTGSPSIGEQLTKETEALPNSTEGLKDGYMTEDGKLVLDFLAAIHAAEKQQAHLDAQVFAEELRALKEKYENELRDLRARELMRIEEAAILDKELKRERTKAAAAIKAIQERMEDKLKTEIEQKETEAQLALSKAEELAKAEMISEIAKEKAAQIEKMAEADLNIKALSMAFYARSEEARQSHSVHKLALGALALDDTLSKGLPIQKEINMLQTYLEGTQKDSILGLVLSSLPEEARSNGTDTVLQLNQKFDTLKGTLRHFSLIPPGGGGILAHSLAQVASWLKFKEVDHANGGIESVIKKVDNYLAEGKLAEAAAALEEGVKGSKAEEIVSDWVRRARNRAITEQALTLLQSYATCVSLT